MPDNAMSNRRHFLQPAALSAFAAPNLVRALDSKQKIRVACVGIGSNLITKEILAAKDWDGLAKKVQETLAIVQRVHGKQP